MLNCLAEHVLHSMLVGDIALDDEDLVWVSAHLLRDEQLLEPPREERERPSRFRERNRALLANTCVHLRLSCDREGRSGTVERTRRGAGDDGHLDVGHDC